MRPSPRLPLLCLALAGCGPGGATAPDGLELASVDAQVAAITLGDECAPTTLQACELGVSCESGCRLSSARLRLSSRALKPVRVAVTATRVFDGSRLVTTLGARASAVRSGSGYQGWGGELSQGATLEVLVELGAPAWSTVSTDFAQLRSTYAVTYSTKLDLLVDGVPATLAGPSTRREPPLP